MIGVMPISGARASDHRLFGRRSSNAKRHKAERSFCCALAISRSARMLSASPTFFSIASVTVGFHDAVNLFLARSGMLLRPAAETLKRRLAGETHRSQVGRVDLRVPAERPEVVVNDGRVQEQRDAPRY